MLLLGLGSTDDDPSAYRKVRTREGHRRVVKHLRQEREMMEQHKEAKKRDRYICAVCSMRFLDALWDHWATILQKHTTWCL